MTRARKRLTKSELGWLVYACDARSDIVACSERFKRECKSLEAFGFFAFIGTCDDGSDIYRPTRAGRAHIRKACEVES